MLNNLVLLFAELEKINIKPKNKKIYLEAITHISYQINKKLNYNYEKLEFLGDALIKKNISVYLFDKFNSPKDLTQTAIKLTNGKTLSEVAKKLNLDKILLFVNLDALQSQNILNDCYEALVGAIFIDLGENTVFEFIKKTLVKLYEEKYFEDYHDFKTKLNSIVYKKYKQPINYIHGDNFVSAYLNDKKIITLDIIKTIKNTEEEIAKIIVEKKLI